VIHIKSISTKKSRGLFAAALLASSFMPSFAGETMHISGDKPVMQKPAESNSLSFFNGIVTFDVQERLRLEVRENNYDFNNDADALTDDGWLLQRFRIGLLIKPVSWIKIYAQGQDSREIDSDRADFPGVLGAEGDDSFDLRQGYIEIGDPKLFPLTLKVGRQILSYGDERLVGAFDWNNIGRTFDAVKLRWEEKLWSLDAFASTVVMPTRGQYNQSDFVNGNETGREQFFAGVYFNTTALPFQSTDIYGFYLSENTGQPLFQPNALDDTGFFTIGFRMKSKPGAFAAQALPESAERSGSDGKEIADTKSMAPLLSKKPVGLDYTLEAAFQTGEVRGLDLTAFAAHLDVGYTFDHAGRPRIALGYSYASGDSDPLDGDAETFQNLFPTNHKFYGQADFFAWQNLHDLEANFKVAPIKSVTLRADFHAFFLASTDDVWYRANGVTAVRPLNAAARNADSYAGCEIDVLATWAATKNVLLEAGYSHFIAGEYLNDTGAASDADFAYVQATFSF
jgi:hypothetical protein